MAPFMQIINVLTSTNATHKYIPWNGPLNLKIHFVDNATIHEMKCASTLFLHRRHDNTKWPLNSPTNKCRRCRRFKFTKRSHSLNMNGNSFVYILQKLRTDTDQPVFLIFLFLIYYIFVILTREVNIRV